MKDGPSKCYIATRPATLTQINQRRAASARERSSRARARTAVQESGRFFRGNRRRRRRRRRFIAAARFREKLRSRNSRDFLSATLTRLYTRRKTRKSLYVYTHTRMRIIYIVRLRARREKDCLGLGVKIIGRESAAALEVENKNPRLHSDAAGAEAGYKKEE